MDPVRMAEQYQAPDDGKHGQRRSPDRMTDLSKSAKQLDGPNRQRQERVTLMLKYFRVTAEERLHETE